ncbi:hypothetical protein LTR37_017787 [Vermiconidia calcicola]|uniref:Uncharacterized protein n=1 Tax=Vermiconidia calcicola TaxID=1690605 RepID=A0ACC3MKG1_9PEZI|nr:hypothetical protein LTR37_017787 [Vermiconidia calcicola]
MPTRAAKRKKVAQSTPAVSAEDDKHTTFTNWAVNHGVEINGVKPASIPDRGVGLLTTKPVKEGDRILFIPEKAMFKPDTALLRRETLDRASPQAQLAVSAMLKFGAKDSSLKLWQDVWPTGADFEDSMPMCWPASTQEFLPPPVQQPLARQLADYRNDWSSARRVCAQHGFIEREFKYYWMIVNSRSFHWKPPRGKGGSMVMCPFIDYMNHGPSGSGCNVSQSPKGYEVVADRDYDTLHNLQKVIHHLPFYVPVHHLRNPDCINMRNDQVSAGESSLNIFQSSLSEFAHADTTAEPGEEVLATYGAHSNDKLLVHYGFICSSKDGTPSPDDEIRLDQLIIPILGADIQNQLQDVGYLGGYALSPASNEICFKTEVAVRATLLTSNEWEYFIASGEDLSVDKSAEVKRYLETLFAEHCKHVKETMEKLRGLDEYSGSAPHTTLLLRWTQVLEGLETFINT